MCKQKKLIAGLIFVCMSWIQSYYAQLAFTSNQKDSVLKLIQNEKTDTLFITNLNLYSSIIRNTNIDSAILLNTKALELSNQINWRYGILNSTLLLGKNEYLKSDYTKALSFFISALKVADELKLSEKQAEIKKSLGNIYVLKSDYDKALDYYFQALNLSKNLNNKSFIAAHYNSIGLAYTYKGETKSGLNYLLKSLEISREINDERSSAVTMDFIGYTYYLMDKYPEALSYLTKSLEINRKLGDKIRIIDNLRNIGEVKTKTNNFKDAENCFNEALKTSEELGHLHGIETNHEALSKLYEKSGQPNLALVHYKKYIATRDSFNTIENEKKQLATEMNYEFDKKQAITKEKNDKEKAVLEERKKLQETITIFVVIGLVIALFSSFFIYRTLKLTKKQKLIIEEKQTEILASITYAKRIQNTLLTHTDFINKHISENFILFKPKDIVSGDFYWATERDGKFYLAICDSTGHGVPGAFMSLLNINFINEAINEKGILKPNEVLNFVRQRLIDNLSKEGQKDGFDGILICIDKASNSITYSAGQNAPLLVSNSRFLKLEADKMPIGIGEKTQPFTLHTIDLKKDDYLYFYTDGFADQFGGPNGKKYKYKQLNQLLQEIHPLPLKEQQIRLESEFEKWKGNLEQVDDVLIIGIKI